MQILPPELLPINFLSKVLYFKYLRLTLSTGALGFEPRMAGPKPAALPLGYAPTIATLINIAVITGVMSSGFKSDFGEISEI